MEKPAKGPKNRRIGVLGGSFDPVHNAHIALAEAAYRQLGLDEIIFMPARQAALKPSDACASPRTARKNARNRARIRRFSPFHKRHRDAPARNQLLDRHGSRTALPPPGLGNFFGLSDPTTFRSCPNGKTSPSSASSRNSPARGAAEFRRTFRTRPASRESRRSASAPSSSRQPACAMRSKAARRKIWGSTRKFWNIF